MSTNHYSIKASPIPPSAARCAIFDAETLSAQRPMELVLSDSVASVRDHILGVHLLITNPNHVANKPELTSGEPVGWLPTSRLSRAVGQRLVSFRLITDGDPG